MAGQNNRQGKKVTGQQAFLAGHCPLTSRYFEPCPVGILLLLLCVQCKLRSLDAPLLYQERCIRVSVIDLEVLICATRLSQISLDNHMQNHETVEPRGLYPYSLTNNYDFRKMVDVFLLF